MGDTPSVIIELVGCGRSHAPQLGHSWYPRASLLLRGLLGIMMCVPQQEKVSGRRHGVSLLFCLFAWSVFVPGGVEPVQYTVLATVPSHKR